MYKRAMATEGDSIPSADPKIFSINWSFYEDIAIEVVSSLHF